MAGGSPLQAPKRGSAPHQSPPAKRHRHNYQYLPQVPVENQDEEELEEGEYTETPLGSPENSPLRDLPAPSEPAAARAGAYEVGEIVLAGGLDRSDTSQASPGLEAGEVLEEDGNAREGGGVKGMQKEWEDGNGDGIGRCGWEGQEGNDGNREEDLEWRGDGVRLEEWESGEVCVEVVENVRDGGLVEDEGYEGKVDVGKSMGSVEGQDAEVEMVQDRELSGVREKELAKGSEPDVGVSEDGGGRKEWVKRDKNWLSEVTAQYGSPYLTPEEDVEYDSGETNKGGHSEMEVMSTSLKGDDSDPFSDIDDSLIDVNEEMDVCKPDSGLRHMKGVGSVQQIEPHTSRDKMSLVDPVSQRSRSDEQASGAPQTNQAGESLSDMTSLLVGDRRQEVSDVRNQRGSQEPVINDVLHVKAGHQIMQDLHSEEQQDCGKPVTGKQKRALMGANKVHGSDRDRSKEASEAGSLHPEDKSDMEEDAPITEGLVPHYGSGDATVAEGLLVSYESVDTVPQGPTQKKSPDQVLSLLAEYGDDDDADADDHEDPAFPQLDEDNDDADNGMDILDEDAGLSDMALLEPQHTPSAETTKRQPVDLPPHLKSLKTPSSPVLITQDNSLSPKLIDNSHVSNGIACDAEDTGHKPSQIEDLEAMLPEEYKDCAEGEVDPVVQKTVCHLLEIQRTQNVYFNEEIMAHKKFRNPCFLTKMSAHFGINEFGTELSPQIYNPHSLAKEENPDSFRVERNRRASTSQVSAAGGAPGVMRAAGPPSAPPGVQNAILQGQRRLREKFTSMAAGKMRPSKWDTGQ